MNADRNRTIVRSNRALLFVIVCPFILFIYPAAALLLSTSSDPVVLNKYSLGATASNLFLLSLSAAFVVGTLTGSSLLLFSTTAGLVLLTYICPASNGIPNWPAVL